MKVVYDLLRQRRHPSTSYHQMDPQTQQQLQQTNGGSSMCANSSSTTSCGSRHIISYDSIQINKELGAGEFGVVQQGMYYGCAPTCAPTFPPTFPPTFNHTFHPSICYSDQRLLTNATVLPFRYLFCAENQAFGAMKRENVFKWPSNACPPSASTHPV